MPTVATSVMFTRHIRFLFNHHHPPPSLAVVPSTTSCHRSSNNEPPRRLQAPRNQHTTASSRRRWRMPAHDATGAKKVIDATGAKKGDVAQRLHEKRGGTWLVHIVGPLTTFVHSFVACTLPAVVLVSIKASRPLPCFLNSSKGPGCRAAMWRGPTRKQTRRKQHEDDPSKVRGSSTLSAH